MSAQRPADEARDITSLLSEALRTLAPGGVATGSRTLSHADVADLHPAESSLIVSSRSRRRIEFASGRSLLRNLLGIDGPIPRHPNGAPQFPGGAKGSLAHDGEVAVAAVTRRADIIALGIDVEPESVLTAAEQAIIVSDADRVDDPLLTFVQKEAVYKAWSSLGGRFLEHHEVVIRSGAGEFSGAVTHAPREFTGRHAVIDGRRLALVVVFA